MDALATGAALTRVGASCTGVTLTAGLVGRAMDQEGCLRWLPLRDDLPVAEEHVEPLEWRLSPALPLLLAMPAAVAGLRIPLKAEPVERLLTLALLLLLLSAGVSDKRLSVLLSCVTVSKLRIGSADGTGVEQWWQCHCCHGNLPLVM